MTLVNPFLVLGIEEGASDVAVEDAFRYLSRNLNPTNFPSGSDAEEQAQRSMSRIVPSYQSLRQPEEKKRILHELEESRKNNKPEDLRPFLGHLCVAAGIITLDDLNEAISKQTDIDLPLGQILQERQLLSQTELEGMLMGQRLFGNPNRPLEPLTRRLLEMSVVTRDMVKIVLIDQRTQFQSTPELLMKRSWLDKRIFDILENQHSTEASTSNSG